MAESNKARRRIVAGPEKRRIEDPARLNVAIERRTAGIVSYYAKTRGCSEGAVVEDALSRYFAGWRIGDPGDAGKGGEAA